MIHNNSGKEAFLRYFSLGDGGMLRIGVAALELLDIDQAALKQSNNRYSCE